MKCSNYGFENEQNGGFCVNCGAPLCQATTPLSEVDTNKILTRQKILDVVQDKLFFIICIVLSVLVGLEAVTNSINIINLLIMIFAWITFANGRKGVADARNIQSISGTVYFIYIINYVAAGLILLACFAMAFFFNRTQFNEMTSLKLYGLEDYSVVLEWFAALPWLIFVLGIILAAICIVLNIFGWRNIHAFIKSVHESTSRALPDYKCCKAARNWLIAFAVMECIELLSFNVSTVLVGILSVAVQIMGAVLINKHFRVSS